MEDKRVPLSQLLLYSNISFTHFHLTTPAPMLSMGSSYLKGMNALELRKVDLRDLRRRAGLTQDELGAKLGVTGRTVCYWECGRHAPRRYQCGILCKELHVSMEALLSALEASRELEFENGGTYAESQS